MAVYRVRGIPASMAAEVRRTGRSVQYPHPAHTEVATGTGPCRACLQEFVVGAEERMLFTYQPFTDPRALPVPGPVFIHRHDCSRGDELGFPDTLRGLPLAFDGFGAEGMARGQVRTAGRSAELALDELFATPGVEYAHVRHGEAGCFIARVDRCFACD